MKNKWVKWDTKRKLHYAVAFNLITVFLTKLLQQQQQQQRGVGWAGIAISLPGLVVDAS